MQVAGIIPARYASTRFPGKPLVLIAGKPLIQRVVERCLLAKSLSEVVVATDDERIAAVARKFCRVEMTREDHPSGTDRIAEAAGRVKADAYINVQGDEPLMDPAVIDAVAAALPGNDMSTAGSVLTDLAEYDNPNVVKVVAGASGRALYFSRRTIPYLRDHAAKPLAEQMKSFPFLKHLGIYGYHRESLMRLVQFPPSPLELAERLEQLRALEAGMRIDAEIVRSLPLGVDTPEDLERARTILSN